jgi:signal peptidase I
MNQSNSRAIPVALYSIGDKVSITNMPYVFNVLGLNYDAHRACWLYDIQARTQQTYLKNIVIAKESSLVKLEQTPFLYHVGEIVKTGNSTGFSTYIITKADYNEEINQNLYEAIPTVSLQYNLSGDKIFPIVIFENNIIGKEIIITQEQRNQCNFILKRYMEHKLKKAY